jgi:hypothetical protein
VLSWAKAPDVARNKITEPSRIPRSNFPAFIATSLTVTHQPVSLSAQLSANPVLRNLHWQNWLYGQVLL